MQMTLRSRKFSIFAIPAVLGMLSACSVGPNYVKPTPGELPPAFKEMDGWKRDYPDAFARKIDPAAGVCLEGWLITDSCPTVNK